MALLVVEGRVTRTESRSGTLDDGSPWAHEAVTVLVDECEPVVVKFPTGSDHGLSKGDIVRMYVDAWKPKLRFSSHITRPVKATEGKRTLASA